MTYDEKSLFKAFTDMCSSLNTKKVKKDEEGTSTVYTGSKSKPWFIRPWSLDRVEFCVYSNDRIIHKKTLNSVIAKFKEKIPQKDVSYIVGDNECAIIFPTSSLQKVVRHFSFKKRNFSQAQIDHQRRFSQIVNSKKEEKAS